MKHYMVGFNTISKGGSGLLMNIVLKILKKNKDKLSTQDIESNITWSGPVDILENFKLFCSHFFGLEKDFEQNYEYAKQNTTIKFFSVVREPKDVIISAYNWIKNGNYLISSINAFIPNISREQYIQLSEEKKLLLLIKSERILYQYKRSIKFSSLNNVKIYRFEDLIDNEKLFDIIIDIHNHIEINDYNIKCIKDDIQNGLYFGEKMLKNSIMRGTTFFKGNSGSYKKYFCRKHYIFFNEFYKNEAKSIFKYYKYDILIDQEKLDIS